MNSVQQQCEHHHWKGLIESFHLSGHTFRFHWTVQDLEIFLVNSQICLGSERVNKASRNDRTALLFIKPLVVSISYAAVLVFSPLK